MNIFSTGNERQLTADYGMYLTLSEDLEAKHLPLCKIVHLDLTDNVGEWKEISEEEAQRIRQAKGHTTAAIDIAKYNQQQKLMTMAINTMGLTDEQALQVKDLYPAWEDLVGQALAAGYKLLYNGNLYKVIQAHTAQSDWLPSDTPALYGLVGTDIEEGEHAGTREDPIPYEQMMVIEQGKYYTQDGVLYVGIMDANTGFPNDLKDLPTLVQPVTEEQE